MLRSLSKPIRTVIAWQAAATLAMTLAGAAFIGTHGAVSAAAGGLVSIIAGLAAASIAARGSGNSAGGILVGALRAEAVKIGLVVLLLWLVLANYADVIVVVVIGSFVVTMLIFAMAFFVREY
ncbi:MAG TPA: ATP synthase subunit I [Burkholderiales bacterium]|nr:ATP synthase subunit I [Burkholderiales bacterium]